MSEATRFTPDMRVLDFAHADRHNTRDAIEDADLVLTTYGTLRRDVAALQEHVFDYVVLDEAQAIKNAATATAKAARLLRARVIDSRSPAHPSRIILASCIVSSTSSIQAFSATGVTSMVQEVQGVQGVQMVQVVQMVSSTTNTWLGSRGGCGPSFCAAPKNTSRRNCRAHRGDCCTASSKASSIESISSCATTIAARFENDRARRVCTIEVSDSRGAAATAAGRVSYLPPSSGPQRRLGEVRSAVASADRSCRRGPQGAGVFTIHKLARVVEASARCRARCLRVSRWTDTRP